MPEDAVNRVVVVVRKGAHLTEYAFLAWLVWRAFRKPVKNDLRPWSWAEARNAMIVVAVYAASDEFHQMFVPNRGAAWHDVLLDCCGGAAGLLLLWALWFRKRKTA